MPKALLLLLSCCCFLSTALQKNLRKNDLMLQSKDDFFEEKREMNENLIVLDDQSEYPLSNVHLDETIKALEDRETSSILLSHKIENHAELVEDVDTIIQRVKGAAPLFHLEAALQCSFDFMSQAEVNLSQMDLTTYEEKEKQMKEKAKFDKKGKKGKVATIVSSFDVIRQHIDSFSSSLSKVRKIFNTTLEKVRPIFKQGERMEGDITAIFQNIYEDVDDGVSTLLSTINSLQELKEYVDSNRDDVNREKVSVTISFLQDSMQAAEDRSGNTCLNNKILREKDNYSIEDVMQNNGLEALKNEDKKHLFNNNNDHNDNWKQCNEVMCWGLEKLKSLRYGCISGCSGVLEKDDIDSLQQINNEKSCEPYCVGVSQQNIITIYLSNIDQQFNIGKDEMEVRATIEKRRREFIGACVTSCKKSLNVRQLTRRKCDRKVLSLDGQTLHCID